MANFIATLSKLTSFANYYFWKICIKLTFALIIYPGTVFTTEDILSASAFSQTTDINKVIRKNFQILAILNFILPSNLSIYDQPNTEALWCYL